MTHHIEQVIRRTQGYFYQDGLVEMLLGFFFLLVGLLFQAWFLLQTGSVWNLLMAVGLPILIIGGVIYIQIAIRYLKESVTYPRTGYAAYKKEMPSHLRRLLMTVPISLAIASILLPQWFSAMSIMEGTLLGLVLIVIGARANLWRFYLLGATSLLIGLAATFVAPGDLPGTAMTFGGCGLALLVSGTITYRRFLRRHPKPVENVL